MSSETITFSVGENLETFSLIWLDASVNDSQENLDAQQQLRTSINFLQTFENGDQCEEYIQAVSKDDRIVLIISGRLGVIVVPRIHSLRQVSAIYVYCKDKKTHEQWSSQFKKVRGVFVLLEELVSLIRSDQNRRNRKHIDEPIPIHVGNKLETSTNDLKGQFIHSELLLDCLLRMEPTSTERDELISLCQEHYKGNELELSLLHEFKKYYSPDRALWWYTREAFLYRLVNKALRVLNIELLYSCRFFLRDLQQQITALQCSDALRLYRYQLMSKEEIELLQNSVDKFIAINSYFSTSTGRDNALAFRHDDSSDLEQVLFQIDADPKLKGLKPFANLQSYSYFSEEEEVLFSYGSVFQILSIEQEEDQLWIIHMVVASEQQHSSFSIFNQMKNEEEPKVFSYGNILREMGQLDLAEKYYRCFLDQSPSNHQDVADCYYSLGIVTSGKGKYEKSLQWHFDALEIKLELWNADDPHIASSYNSMAIVYRKKGDYSKALDYGHKALMIWESSYGKNHPKVAKCLNNIGVVYEDQEEYSKALENYQRALDIGQKNPSIDYQGLSATHNNIGNIYDKFGDYDKALEHYTKSFQLKSEFLPAQHPSIATALQNIEIIREKTRHAKNS